MMRLEEAAFGAVCVVLRTRDGTEPDRSLVLRGDSMKVLMLGWEFPPYISGGLGTACAGLCRAMSGLGVDVMFVLPQHIDAKAPGTSPPVEGDPKVVTPDGTQQPARPVRFLRVDAELPAYRPTEFTPTAVVGKDGIKPSVSEARRSSPGKPRKQQRSLARAVVPFQAIYSGDLIDKANYYRDCVLHLAEDESFDLIHAHDWLTFPAAAALAEESDKPMIVHVHSTEYDRSGEHGWHQAAELEKHGMDAATRVMAVSAYTKGIITSRYGIPPEKVDVVHNAVELPERIFARSTEGAKQTERVVLFLGRITMQKGPEYFVRAAKRVLEVMKNVRFVMAGSGDMAPRSMELANELGIGDRVLFTGFLRGEEIERAFAMADLYVMTSVSEPFGITPLEAIARNVPVLISKQSGVSEVFPRVLKMDFWDIDDIADKIISVLRYEALHNTLRDEGTQDLRRMSWHDSARQCLRSYERALHEFAELRGPFHDSGAGAEA